MELEAFVSHSAGSAGGPGPEKARTDEPASRGIQSVESLIIHKYTSLFILRPNFDHSIDHRWSAASQIYHYFRSLTDHPKSLK